MTLLPWRSFRYAVSDAAPLESPSSGGAGRSSALSSPHARSSESPAEVFSALLDFIVETHKLAALALDTEGTIVFANSGATDILKLPREALLGKSVETLFTEVDRQHGIPDIELDRARETGFAPDERWHLRQGGEKFWAAGTLIALRSGDGRLLGFWKLFRDRTVMKHTEEELHSPPVDVETFASTAAHDLKEPLRTISLLLQTIERHAPLDDANRRHLENAIRASQRAHALVSDMLAWGEVRHAPRTRSSVDVNTIVDLAIATLHGAIEDSGGFVTRGVLPTVQANPLDLQRVFQNLIGNGLKYHGAFPPRIVVCADSSATEHVFRICDNGVGIASQDLSRVFEPFRRVSGDRKVPGTGLGLSLCRAIVENHGGRIWAESTPGQGTTVYFTLPSSPSDCPSGG